MIRKVRFRIETRDCADVVLAARREDDELCASKLGWSKSFEDIGRRLDDAFANMSEEAEALEGFMEGLGESVEDFSVGGASPNDPGDFVNGWEISLDLALVAESGIESLRALHALIEYVEASSWYFVGEIKLGGKRADVGDLRREIQAAATSIGQRLDPAQAQAHRAEPGAHRGSHGSRKSGSWGDAEFDESRQRPRPAEAAPSTDGSVHYFWQCVSHYQLPLPTNGDELRKTYRQLAQRVHPDKHGGSNTMAKEAFQFVTQGYEALKKSPRFLEQ